MRIVPFDKVKASKWEVVIFSLLFGLITWVMFHTFSYDSEESKFLISGAMWSDFAATMPLIRSFGMGDNWPPEYPIFPGYPIRYHYLFFLVVGKLEAIGVPLHWAVNIPSVAGFFAILLMIYLIAKKWFGDARVGYLGIAFFLLNGSMGFLQFFEKKPLSVNSIREIVTNDHFHAMGPWDGGNVLGVWHLLVYINQRHFIVALGVLLTFIYVCHCFEGKSRKSQLRWALGFGIAIGLFPLFHKAVLLIFAVVMLVYFLFVPAARLFLFATGAVSIVVMGALWLLPFSAFGAPPGFGWHPGFMIHGSLSFVNALEFFWYQFGLHTLLIPIGFFLAPGRVKLFMLPALIVFVIAFLFRFSQIEVLVGHKFFNFFLILAQMLSAYAITRGYDWFAAKFPRQRFAAFGAAGVLVFFLTLSGFIDLFPLANMEIYKLRDVGSNLEAQWFAENTPKDAVVLSSQYLYSPASIGGRKIFVGYGYFTDSAGYNTRGRLKMVEAIYRGGNRESICRLLRLNNISYVDVEDFGVDKGRPDINLAYFRENFTPEFVSKKGRFEVYTADEICGSP